MPTVSSHTPAWLARPSTGFQLFQPGEKSRTTNALSNGAGKKVEHRGPRRTIAHRGTEIFFVVGNEIRWSDLVLLKDGGDEQGVTRRSTLGGGAASTGGIEERDDFDKYCKVHFSIAGNATSTNGLVRRSSKLQSLDKSDSLSYHHLETC